jgi:hypothetical protein
MPRTVIDAIDQGAALTAGLLLVNNDLLRTGNDLARLTYILLGGAPMTPAALKARTASPAKHLSTHTGSFGPGTYDPGTRGSGRQPPRIPGQDVNVVFTWDPPVDAGLTTGYALTIFNPDSSIFDRLILGPGTSFVETMPDDTRTYVATLVATGDPLTTTPSDPATTSFVPHTEGPPPPTKLDTPTGFTATPTTP